MYECGRLGGSTYVLSVEICSLSFLGTSDWDSGMFWDGLGREYTYECQLSFWDSHVRVRSGNRSAGKQIVRAHEKLVRTEGTFALNRRDMGWIGRDMCIQYLG